MKGKILITGANGFVGYHLTEAAQQAGFLIDAAVRKGSDTTLLNTLTSPGIRYVYPDYSSVEALTSLVSEGEYDYIIHVAGATKAADLEGYNKVNVNYTVNLANAALTRGQALKRFVFISSLAAIGPVGYQQQTPINENTIPRPVTSYGKSKLMAEQKLSAMELLPLTIIRPTAVYGPGEKDILVLFKLFNRGLEAYIGRQPQILSFVYVKDLVAAIISALKTGEKQKLCYNISDGKAYQRYDLADHFKNLTGKKTIRLHLPETFVRALATVLGGISAISGKTSVLNREKINELTAPNWNCSITAAVNELGYVPRHDLSSGILKTIQWYKQNNWLND